MSQSLAESIKLDLGANIADTSSGNMAVIHDSFVHQLNDFLAKKSQGAIKQAIILELDAPVFKVLASGTAIISRV
jgi:hypothetical protein